VIPQSSPTSAQRFAATIADRCDVVVIGLQVWRTDPGQPYNLLTELAAVQRAARDRGWSRYHLVGFSAGATVALATARADPDTVRSLALVEPATIGDDDWSPTEKQWREDLRRVRRLPPDQRQAAFRRILMAAGEEVPAELGPPPLWDTKTERLENLLAKIGFESGDLSDLTQPTLIISGAQSCRRFHELAERLVDVLPNATSITLPLCSHLRPPHRAAPDQFEEQLKLLWNRTPDTKAFA
jgi:pimeloyl-ACP methyl ester carboxylesterase